MNTILIFIIVMAAISIIGVKFKLPPFFTLVGGAVAFGLMIGSSPDTVFQQVALGCASIFNSLGIPILAGSVASKISCQTGVDTQIVSDLRTLLKRPPTLSVHRLPHESLRPVR